MDLKQLLGFLVSGGVATVLNYCVFWFALSQSLEPLVASAIGYVSGIVVSFTINRLFVFRRSVRPSFVKYALVYFGALCIQLIALSAFLALGLRPEIANGIAIILVVIINFFVMRKLVFSD